MGTDSEAQQQENAQVFTLTARPLTSGLPLTSLSPLSEPAKVQHTGRLEDIALGLSTYGFDVGYSKGQLQVSQPKPQHFPPSAPPTLSMDTFMGGLTRTRTQFLYRPKVASSVTFTRAPGTKTGSATVAAVEAAAGRPRTAPASSAPTPTRGLSVSLPGGHGSSSSSILSGQAQHLAPPPPPGVNLNNGRPMTPSMALAHASATAGAIAAAVASPTSIGTHVWQPQQQGSPQVVQQQVGAVQQGVQGGTLGAGASTTGRFSRLSQSMDALHGLKGGPVKANGINPANLAALHEPSFRAMQQYQQQHAQQYGRALGRPQTASPTVSPSQQQQPQGVTQQQPMSARPSSPGPMRPGSPGPMQPSDGWPPSPGWRSPALPDPAVQWSPSGTGTTGPGGTGSAEDGNTGSTLRPQTPQVIQLDTAASAAMATGPRPNTASPRTDGWGSLQSFGPRAGTPSRGGRPRTGNQGWMDFRPTRAHALLVFQHMDLDHNGKLTLAELEDAAMGVGFTLDQAHKLFSKLDRGGKGFLQASDWGQADVKQIVQLFTQMYMQRFMGVPGPTSTAEQVRKYKAIQALKSVGTIQQAMNMVKLNAMAKGTHGATTTGNPIYDAFSFIDTDGSGFLSYSELRDGFAALGVDITEEVARQLMDLFDSDHSGTINYHEFLSNLFPTRAHG